MSSFFVFIFEQWTGFDGARLLIGRTANSGGEVVVGAKTDRGAYIPGGSYDPFVFYNNPDLI